MSINKYKVFENKGSDFLKIHPELTFLLSGIIFDIGLNINIDNLIRYIVYFYSRDCDLHFLYSDVTKSRAEALDKFNISKRIYNDKKFIIIESEMAKRFMLWGRDNEFSVYITISMQLEDLNDKIRTMGKDTNMVENVNSLKVSSEILSLSEKIDQIKDRLFGKMLYIEEYASRQIIENKYKAELSIL